MKLGALLAVGVSLFSLNAFAADDDYMKFLGALEGNWQGQGEIRYYSGSGQSGSYGFEMSDSREGDTTTWIANISKRSSMGGGDRDTVTFYATGQFLLINHESIFGGSASVEFSTDHSVDYTVSENDFGSFIDHHFHWEVSGNRLSGHVTVERNGMPVSDERWSARKGQ